MEKLTKIKTSHTSFRYNFEVLSLSLLNNLDYFYSSGSKYWYSEKYVNLLQCMLDLVRWYESNINQLSENVDRFDINCHILGNGYRSFDIIFQRFFSECYRFSKELSSKRNSTFFLPGLYIKRLEAHLSVLDGLKPALSHLLKMMEENTSNQPLLINKHVTAEELVKEYALLDQTCFYGRCQSFYFCNSMRNILWGVSILMASFSDLYQKSGGPLSRAISAVLNGLKYIMDPEQRSRQIVDIAQNASVEFLKSFWSLSETHFMMELPKWICPNLEVLEELFVPSKPVSLKTEDGSKVVTIPIPSSHIPPAPVRCLLMSYCRREGQSVKGCKQFPNSSPPSSSLLFHCHGGGFVSQKPECHEIYLRHWAKDLNIPILSVDYSLSPTAPFPRALEEVLLAYAWALKNPEKLGWTGERVCFAGDSAGGNILMGIVLKTVSLGIRKPDAILCAYSPLILDLVPSPSRLLCWLDPLLPFGFMLSCLDSYVGAMQTDTDEYIEASKPSSSRERKLSSISEILDSSLLFLNENEWAEVQPNEPDSKIIEVTPESVDRDYLGEPRVKFSQSTPLKEYNRQEDYVSDFIKQYHSMCVEKARSAGNNRDDGYRHEVYNFPEDLMHNVRQKCTDFVLLAVQKTAEVVEENKWFKTLILPWIPSTFHPKATSKPVLFRSESSVTDKIKRLKLVTSNPYISPLLVSNDVLKEMPPVYFLALNFDPCLDDSITFAKRMESVGKSVVIDVLDGLPHGFLNFLPFSQEAHDGSDVCVKRIREALHLNEF